MKLRCSLLLILLLSISRLSPARNPCDGTSCSLTDLETSSIIWAQFNTGHYPIGSGNRRVHLRKNDCCDYSNIFVYHNDEAFYFESDVNAILDVNGTLYYSSSTAYGDGGLSKLEENNESAETLAAVGKECALVGYDKTTSELIYLSGDTENLNYNQLCCDKQYMHRLAIDGKLKTDSKQSGEKQGR